MEAIFVLIPPMASLTSFYLVFVEHSMEPIQRAQDDFLAFNFQVLLLIFKLELIHGMIVLMLDIMPEDSMQIWANWVEQLYVFLVPRVGRLGRLSLVLL